MFGSQYGKSSAEKQLQLKKSSTVHSHSSKHNLDTAHCIKSKRNDVKYDLLSEARAKGVHME